MIFVISLNHQTIESINHVGMPCNRRAILAIYKNKEDVSEMILYQTYKAKKKY